MQASTQTSFWMRRRVVSYSVQVALVVGAVAFLRYGPFHYYDGETKADRAVMDARGLVEACAAYHKLYGVYPATLADVVHPGDGRRPPIEGGRDATIDPWGHPYRYAAVPVEDGTAEVHVWFEQTADGKTTLVGVKRMADGTKVYFGR